jgi:hypothetical protein
MKTFIDSYPGLQSRFNRYIEFPDYSAQELYQIFELYLTKSDYTIAEDAIGILQNYLTISVTNKDKNFGNARFVRNLFDKTIERQTNRLSKEDSLTNEKLSEICAIDVQYFEATPFSLGEQTVLNMEQIIPIPNAPDIENYMIKMREEAQEEKSAQEGQIIRNKFWIKLLSKFKPKSTLFANISASKDNWIETSAGVGGVKLFFGVSKKYARVGVYISTGDIDKNKFIFDQLHREKEEIEKQTGTLEWDDENDTKKTRIIKKEMRDVNVSEKDDWDKMMNFMMDNMSKIENAFKEPLQKMKK